MSIAFLAEQSFNALQLGLMLFLMAVGAALFLLLIEIVSHYTDFWAFYIGIAVIVRVLLVRDGLLAKLQERLAS